MTFVLILIGAALSAAVCGGMFDEPTAVTAAILGGCIGWLLGQLRRLRARVAETQKQLAQLRADVGTSKISDAVVRCACRAESAERPSLSHVKRRRRPSNPPLLLLQFQSLQYL